jgi:cardiolipin synthase
MRTHLPNLLTILRLAAAPVLVLLLKDRHYDSALAVIVLAGISDGLDGFIAKRFKAQSALGAVLDPLADKILLVSSFVMLALLDLIPFWLLVAVVFRDLLIVSGYLAVMLIYGSVNMQPSAISKLNTVLQIGLVVAVLLHEAAGWPPFAVVQVLTAMTLLTTLVSGVHYVWIWGFGRESRPAA